MDKAIRGAQQRVLRVFARKAKVFALAGGTALEAYYLHHRFSADLDFFSPRYDLAEINKIVAGLAVIASKRIKLESEFMAAGRAKVRFYSLPFKGSDRPLKIDFVEDVVVRRPHIRVIAGVRLYRAEDIYWHKIFALCGTREQQDETGRRDLCGRNEARDVFDIYCLSKKIKPLHIFLQKFPSYVQRGMVRWYQVFSRQELKISLLDLEIYERGFDPRELIRHLEGEIQLLLRETAGLE